MARHRLFDAKRKGHMVRRITPAGHLYYEGRWMWAPMITGGDKWVPLSWPTVLDTSEDTALQGLPHQI